MAMPQRDEKIEEIKRLDALLEYAVVHGGCQWGLTPWTHAKSEK